MSRGYWTYHHTYKSGCCGGPGCILMLLTVPVWPLIGGFIAVKDRIPMNSLNRNFIEKTIDNTELSMDAEDISFEELNV